MHAWVQIYLSTWIVLTACCLILLVRQRQSLLLFQKKYISFLFQKWKISVLFIATAFLVYISRLWYDPTWDIPETIVMSLLTYYTAPYVVGTLFRKYNGFQISAVEIYIAIILLLFSSAWFYDIYAMIVLLWWEYPSTFLANLWISPFFYILAWMMWSLVYRRSDGVIFAYNCDEWVECKGDSGGLWKIIIHSLPMAGFVTLVFCYFIYLNR